MIGKNLESEREEAEKRQEDVAFEQIEDEFSMAQLSSDHQDLDHEHHNDSYNHFDDDDHIHNHPDYEYADQPDVDFDPHYENEIPVLADFYEDEVISKAYSASESFVKAIYEYEGESIADAFEKAQEFATPELVEQKLSLVPRTTSEMYSRELIEIDAYEPYNPDGNDLILHVRVSGQCYDFNGEETFIEIAEYRINVESNPNSVKVKDFKYIQIGKG